MKKYLVAISFFVAFPFALLTLSCTRHYRGPAYFDNGGAFFRHRWWNYYERGLIYSDEQSYQEAMTDFQSALKLREKDQRRARTYGMHFMDYFPHRELGIIHYHMKNLQAAKSELELSVNQYPSAKAYFYLDRVRKKLIEHEVKIVPPPRITLNLKAGPIWTREDPVVIAGLAEDERYVSSITIHGLPLFIEGSQKRIPFEKNLKLSQGRHIVEVEAKNLMGKVEKKQVILHVDREGPVIAIDELTIIHEGSEERIMISGSIYDKAGVSNLTLNGQEVAMQKGSDVDVIFSHTMARNTDSLDLLASDSLGNQTSARIPVPSDRASRTPVLLACAEPQGSRGLLYAKLFGSGDTRSPMIRLNGWTEKQSVFLEKIYLDGEVSDESDIVTLTINQIPILHRPGKILIFNHFIELKKGENIITIEAEDKQGNKAVKQISVIRLIPKALLLDERLRLTVLPFEQKGAVSKTSTAFQGNLIDALFNEKRFRVVERNMLDLILQEHKLNRTKLINRDTALQVGEMLAAQSIITGNIIETRTGIEIVARMIDIETSEIVATADVYDEIKDLTLLKSLAAGLALKFHREFPLVDGAIIKKSGNYIFTDLGQDKISVHRRLIIYREEPVKHPVTGKEFGADCQIIDRARILQVSPEMSKARIIQGKAKQVDQLDKVITE
ncbi:MAG: FlgO family outer membrane protein [bacterium]